MAVETFEDLFMRLARDAYQAEKQHIKALPKMARSATHPDLEQAFEQHLEETEQQVERLERIFSIMGVKGKGSKSEGAGGLISEAQDVIGEIDDEQMRDAGIIAAAQALEHYEIARYGTLVAWAQKIGQREVVKLLQESLREEHNANQLLNQLAEQTINEEAFEQSEDEQAEQESSKRRGGRQGQQLGRGFRPRQAAASHRRQPTRKSGRRANQGKSRAKSSSGRKAA